MPECDSWFMQEMPVSDVLDLLSISYRNFAWSFLVRHSCPLHKNIPSCLPCLSVVVAVTRCMLGKYFDTCSRDGAAHSGPSNTLHDIYAMNGTWPRLFVGHLPRKG